jgi:hypothetical protein
MYLRQWQQSSRTILFRPDRVGEYNMGIGGDTRDTRPHERVRTIQYAWRTAKSRGHRHTLAAWLVDFIKNLPALRISILSTESDIEPN